MINNTNIVLWILANIVAATNVIAVAKANALLTKTLSKNDWDRNSCGDHDYAKLEILQQFKTINNIEQGN